MIYTKKGLTEYKYKDKAETLADLYCILRMAIEGVGLDGTLLHKLVEAAMLDEDEFEKILRGKGVRK